eukprot:Rhum_TRINITY_DN14343_c26_g1::Rhum_TRINITY_DN14343_c26_g1_i1::g.83947::m.83947
MMLSQGAGGGGGKAERQAAAASVVAGGNWSRDDLRKLQHKMDALEAIRRRYTPSRVEKERAPSTARSQRRSSVPPAKGGTARRGASPPAAAAEAKETLLIQEVVGMLLQKEEAKGGGGGGAASILEQLMPHMQLRERLLDGVGADSTASDLQAEQQRRGGGGGGGSSKHPNHPPPLGKKSLLAAKAVARWARAGGAAQPSQSPSPAVPPAAVPVSCGSDRPISPPSPLPLPLSAASAQLATPPMTEADRIAEKLRQYSLAVARGVGSGAGGGPQPPSSTSRQQRTSSPSSTPAQQQQQQQGRAASVFSLHSRQPAESPATASPPPREGSGGRARSGSVKSITSRLGMMSAEQRRRCLHDAIRSSDAMNRGAVLQPNPIDVARRRTTSPTTFNLDRGAPGSSPVSPGAVASASAAGFPRSPVLASASSSLGGYGPTAAAAAAARSSPLHRASPLSAT